MIPTQAVLAACDCRVRGGSFSRCALGVCPMQFISYDRAGPVDLNRFLRSISGPCGVRLLRPKAEAAKRSTPRSGFELDGSSVAGACCRS